VVETNNLVVGLLFVAAFGLLIVVSGGIIYLTTVEWRDRRRQNKEKRGK
jgi:hypothetical protein